MWLLSYSILGLISPVSTLTLTKNYKLFNESPTVRLTAQNFAQEVNSSPNPWIIVIYSESSKLCKRYSNGGWPKLVKAIGEWEDKFSEIFGKNRMGAIEEGEGLFATNEYDFPIIKIFPPNSSGVPLSKKINWYSTDEMLEILLAIHKIGKEEVLPKTSQEWTTRIDKIWNNWQKELALANKGEKVVLETYTQIIRTVTTTRVVNPFRLFIGVIFLFLLCLKWIVKCGDTGVPEDNEHEEPETSFHRAPEYSYDHPQPQARSQAIPLPPS